MNAGVLDRVSAREVEAGRGALRRPCGQADLISGAHVPRVAHFLPMESESKIASHLS